MLGSPVAHTSTIYILGKIAQMLGKDKLERNMPVILQFIRSVPILLCSEIPGSDGRMLLVRFGYKRKNLNLGTKKISFFWETKSRCFTSKPRRERRQNTHIKPFDGGCL